MSAQVHNAVMLYKFKSKATGDLIMLEPQGRQILQIIGKEPGPQGIVEPHEMLAAIEALKAAVLREEAHQKAVAQGQSEPNASEDKDSSGARAISLKQRVVPVIDMLQRAHAQGKDIVWGV